MRALFLTIGRIHGGWAVYTTNGAVLAAYTGFAARWRAERYLVRLAGPVPHV